MVRCPDYWKKFRKEPNFCGLGGSTVRQMNKYLDFVDWFSDAYGIHEDIVYNNAPCAAMAPLLRFSKESETWRETSDKVAETLKSKQAVSAKYVEKLIGIEPPRKKAKVSPVMAVMSEMPKEVFDTKRVSDKIRLINSALTTGQRGILMSVMEKEGLDNEYEALNRVLLWAKARIDGA